MQCPQISIQNFTKGKVACGITLLSGAATAGVAIAAVNAPSLVTMVALDALLGVTASVCFTATLAYFPSLIPESIASKINIITFEEHSSSTYFNNYKIIFPYVLYIFLSFIFLSLFQAAFKPQLDLVERVAAQHLAKSCGHCPF